MKKFIQYQFILIFILVFANSKNIKSANSQKNIVSGIITDAKTAKPIPYVEVFISGTTVGTITNEKGEYSLKLPFYPCTFVASHVSYDAFIKTVEEPYNNLNIELVPSNVSIDEVIVKRKNKRKQNLRFFYDRFLPEGRNKIDILNDEVLIFEKTETTFNAYSYEPLILINKFLGYKIKLILSNFEVVSVDGPNGNSVPFYSTKGGEIKKLTGYYYYEPIIQTAGEKVNYERNRMETYFGSYRHFLKSVYDEEISNQGYKIEAIQPDTGKAFVQLDIKNILPNSKKYMINAEKFEIHYYFDENKMPIDLDYLADRFYFYKRESTIYATPEPFIIRENGTSPNLTFVIDGLLAIKSFANSLPDDYEPDE